MTEANEDHEEGNFYTTLKEHLCTFGLAEWEAERVLEQYMNAAQLTKPERDQWNDKLSLHPPIVRNYLQVALEFEAVKWVETNAPEHPALEQLKSRPTLPKQIRLGATNEHPIP